MDCEYCAPRCDFPSAARGGLLPLQAHPPVRVWRINIRCFFPPPSSPGGRRQSAASLTGIDRMLALRRWEGLPVCTCRLRYFDGSARFGEQAVPGAAVPQFADWARSLRLGALRQRQPGRALPRSRGTRGPATGRDYGFDMSMRSYYFLRCWLWPFRFLASEKFYF